jgi:serine protease Do
MLVKLGALPFWEIPMKRFIWLLTLINGSLWLTTATAANEYPDFTRLIAENKSAVVSINASGERQISNSESLPIPEDSPFYDYYRRFFEEEEPGMPRRRRPLSSVGSGFVISPDGYILTNSHVIEDTGNIVVGLDDRTELPATIIGSDPRTDVARIKVDAQNLPTVKVGDPDKLVVGQWVLAIGSPFGFNYTATQGIISGLGRSLPSGNYVPFIQTDAAVNPGNSGGPLFNLAGEVIGINSQIYSRTGGYQGVSFAIPIDVAIDVADQLRVSGKVSRGWLGVLIQEVSADLAESFGLHRPQGALIGQVMADSPAQKAGLKAGDIIVAFNGQSVGLSSELPPLVGRVRPGKTAMVTVIRDGEEKVIPVDIEELPADPEQRQASTGLPAQNRLKITVEELTPEQKQITDGVVVKDMEAGPASEAGIEPGDIIVRLNNEKISDVAQFEELIQDLPADKPLPVLIQRDNGALFLALTLSE